MAIETSTFDASSGGTTALWTFYHPDGTNTVGATGTANRQWKWANAETASANVGPLIGYDTAGYVYTEASSATVANDEFYMVRNEVYDASNTEVKINFFFSARFLDAETVTLSVKVFNGTSWVIESSQVVGNGADATWFAFGEVDLSAYTNVDLQVQISVTMPSTGTIWHCDLGIDGVTIETGTKGTPVTVLPDLIDTLVIGQYEPAIYTDYFVAVSAIDLTLEILLKYEKVEVQDSPLLSFDLFDVTIFTPTVRVDIIKLKVMSNYAQTPTLTSCYATNGWSCPISYHPSRFKVNNFKESTVATLGSTWTLGNAFPVNMSKHQVFVTSTRVYAWAEYDSPTKDGYYAEITNGTLGVWNAVTDFNYIDDYTETRYIQTNTKGWTLGAYRGSGQYLTFDYVLKNTITAGASNAPAYYSPKLAYKVSVGQVLSTKDRVYYLGGNDYSNTIATIMYAPVDLNGDLGTWVQEGSLLYAVEEAEVIITKSRVYVLGGYNGSAKNYLQHAPLNADGSIGTWVNSGNNMPVANYRFNAIVLKDRVFLVGGQTTTIYTAVIDDDGIIGSWSSAGSLATDAVWSQVIVTSNKVYILGDWASTSCYYADFVDGWEITDDDNTAPLCLALPTVINPSSIFLDIKANPIALVHPDSLLLTVSVNDATIKYGWTVAVDSSLLPIFAHTGFDIRSLMEEQWTGQYPYLLNSISNTKGNNPFTGGLIESSLEYKNDFINQNDMSGFHENVSSNFWLEEPIDLDGDIDYTVGYWFYADSSGNGNVTVTWNATLDGSYISNGLRLRRYNQQFYIEYGSRSSTFVTTISEGWHLLICQRKQGSTGIETYLDNTLLGTAFSGYQPLLYTNKGIIVYSTGLNDYITGVFYSKTYWIEEYRIKYSEPYEHNPHSCIDKSNSISLTIKQLTEGVAVPIYSFIHYPRFKAYSVGNVSTMPFIDGGCVIIDTVVFDVTVDANAITVIVLDLDININQHYGFSISRKVLHFAHLLILTLGIDTHTIHDLINVGKPDSILLNAHSNCGNTILFDYTAKLDLFEDGSGLSLMPFNTAIDEKYGTFPYNWNENYTLSTDSLFGANRGDVDGANYSYMYFESNAGTGGTISKGQHYTIHFKQTAVGDGCVIRQGQASDPFYSWELISLNGTYQVWFGDSANDGAGGDLTKLFDTGLAVTIGSWQFITAYVTSGNLLRITIDGVADIDRSIEYTALLTRFGIGSSKNDYGDAQWVWRSVHSGHDQFRVFNREMTTEELALVRLEGESQFCPSRIIEATLLQELILTIFEATTTAYTLDALIDVSSPVLRFEVYGNMTSAKLNIYIIQPNYTGVIVYTGGGPVDQYPNNKVYAQSIKLSFTSLYLAHDNDAYIHAQSPMINFTYLTNLLWETVHPETLTLNVDVTPSVAQKVNDKRVVSIGGVSFDRGLYWSANNDIVDYIATTATTVNGKTIYSVMPLKKFTKSYTISTKTDIIISEDTFSELKSILNTSTHKLIFNDGSFEYVKFDFTVKPMIASQIFDSSNMYYVDIGVLL